MNVITRTVYSILSRFNNFVDNLDKRYLDMIRQIAIFLISALWITGLILGYLHGRGAAKKTGITILESTNDVLSIDVNLEKEDNFFQDVLKDELSTEMNKPEYSKETMYEAPDLRTELKTEIFESDLNKKEDINLSPMKKEGISELPLIDSTSRENDSSGIIEKEELMKPGSSEKKIDNKKTEDTNTPVKSDLNSINKNDGIVE
ncbi:MAG: hypothetical protein JW982_08975 [Spirochaetes bacterium]|nr:hypothetical protein [Spirochaetota bacterium]